MSSIQHDTDWVCDICETTIKSKNYPESFSKLRIEAKRSGFNHYTNIDLCEGCISKTMFRDPPKTEPLDDTLIRKIVKRLGGNFK
jgi:hypothetical protein